jgi:maltodextrin utilization protein YvdJ
MFYDVGALAVAVMVSFAYSKREAYAIETLVLSRYLPISDKLNLGLMRYRLQVWM